MRNSENAFGYCEAGCPREVLSYADFEKSLPQYEKVAPDADGLTRLEAGKLYKIIPKEIPFELYLGFKKTEESEIVYTSIPILKGVGIKEPFSYYLSNITWAYHNPLDGSMIITVIASFFGQQTASQIFTSKGIFYNEVLWTNGEVYLHKNNVGIVLGGKSKDLPAVTEDDNGKILAVSRGMWQVKNNK